MGKGEKETERKGKRKIASRGLSTDPSERKRKRPPGKKKPAKGNESARNRGRLKREAYKLRCLKAVSFITEREPAQGRGKDHAKKGREKR